VRARRKLWPFGLGLVALIAAVLAGTWFAFRGKVARASMAMLEDALQMTLEPRARPVHAMPSILGSFGKCVEPRLDQWSELLKDEPEVCKAFRAPKAPKGRIPDECLAIVTPKNSLAWARGLMSCSRADTAGLPEGLFSAGHKRNGPKFTPWIEAAKVLAWEIRAQTATGQYGLAFETCADVLASSRDLTWGGALLGTMVSAANVKTVFPACAEAVGAADAASRKKFHAALEIIRAGKRTNSAMLRDEGVIAGLEHFGFELDPKQQSTLPKELRDRIRPAPPQFPAPILLARQMVGLRSMVGDLRQIADLPAAERATYLPTLTEKHRAMEATAPSVAAQEKLLRRADEASTLIAMLSAAANPDAVPVTTETYTVTPVEAFLELAPVDPDAASYTIRIPASKK
jgi:hypothetical protein